MASKSISIFDTLYGRVEFEGEIAELIEAPLVQRLRHIRLSNIDSVAMPGIANISRFEHVLGTAAIARSVGFSPRLSSLDRLALISAALLHDWAITAFGHLVEEAFRYVGTSFEHESRLHDIISGKGGSVEVGDVNRQILRGRETGLARWAERAGGGSANELLLAITDAVRGRGKFGGMISGTIDLDNIDNVHRIAYHMGMEIDRQRPMRLAEQIVDAQPPNGLPVFTRNAEADIEGWLKLRRDVYERLMPAEPDFAYKVMILYGAVEAFRAGEIVQTDWALTDQEFLQKLLGSRVTSVRDTIDRWMSGEAWDTTPLRWLSGDRPDYSQLLLFSEKISQVLQRPCFAYGIKDKRNRKLTIRFDDGSEKEFGSTSHQWLLGIGSSKRRAFSRSETQVAFETAREFFGSNVIDQANVPGLQGQLRTDQNCFI